MPRPQIDADVAQLVEEIVDREADVPAGHLTFAQRVEYLANNHENYAREVRQLRDRLDDLETQQQQQQQQPSTW